MNSRSTIFLACHVQESFTNFGSSEWHGRSTKYPAVPPFFLCSWAWELQDGWSFAIFNMQLQELIELKNSTLSYKHSSQMGFRNESKNLCILEYWLFSHFGLESLMSTSETTPQQYFFLKKNNIQFTYIFLLPQDPYPIPTKPPQRNQPLGIQETSLHKELKPWSPGAVEDWTPTFPQVLFFWYVWICYIVPWVKYVYFFRNQDENWCYILYMMLPNKDLDQTRFFNHPLPKGNKTRVLGNDVSWLI